MTYRKSEHPGVYIKQRYGHWVGVFKDVVTGKERQINISEFGCTTKALAKQWAIIESQRRRTLIATLKAKGGANRVGTDPEQFVEEFLFHRGDSANNDRNFLEHSFWPWLRSLKLKSCAEINQEALRAYRRHLALQDIAGATKNRYLSVVKSLVGFGRKNAYLIIEYEDAKDALASFSKGTRKAPVVLEPEALKRVIHAVVSRDLENSSRKGLHFSRLSPATFFLMLTGVRLREMLNAQWEGVSWRRKTIRIKEDPSTGFRIKTRTDRDIGFADSPALERMLLALRSEPGLYIISGEDPNRPKYWSKDTWRRMRRRNNIGEVNPKNFRSTFASAIAMAKHGVTVQAHAKRLGHSLETAMEYYVDGGLKYEGESVEEWLGIGKEIESAMDALGWPKLQKK